MHPLLRHKTLLLDLDGTMYRGDAVIPGAPLFIEALHTLQIPYYFLTNNAMRTHAQNDGFSRIAGCTVFYECDGSCRLCPS